MTDTLVLLGDSVIDNAAYVRPGEPDVPAQVRRALPTWTVDSRALDGSIAADVTRQLAPRLPPGAAVFLSVGGNDALSSIDLLTDPTPLPFADAMVRLGQVQARFRGVYGAALDAVRRSSTRVMTATIYNPAFSDAESALQAPAEAALSAFNDVIQQESLARGFGVLDLRRLFDEWDCYANPIEPSAKGGARIAAAIAGWLERG